MSLRINLNSAALTAHRNLSGADNAMGKSIERLSSGFKINSAGDDPAGLVVSEKLRAQVGGLGQAIRNASDAVNMVKTAEGALGEVNRLLRSMRDLAVHAANTGVTDTASITADQAQIANALDSIDKIASETQFGGKMLLDGSAGISTIVTGSSTSAANFSGSTTIKADNAFYVSMAAGQGGIAATQATLTGTVVLGNDAAKSITINGVAITGGADAATTIANINAKSNETGVIASNSGGSLKLTHKEFGSTARIDITNGTELYKAAVATDAAVGINAVAKVTSDAAYNTNLTDAAVWDKGTGLVLKDSEGNTITLTDVEGALQTAKGLQGKVEVGELEFQVGAYKDQTRTLTIGSVSTANIGKGMDSTYDSLSKIDVTKDAQIAIAVLDQAISDISTQRATLGATQKNVLESSINSLTIAKENVAASESSIRDTDMAAEMVEFTRNQIMQQAGTAMLSQANQSAQGLLSLLR